MKRLTTLYELYAGEQPQACEPITGSGSNRQYFRLTGSGGQTVVGVIGTNIYENNAFIYLSKQFTARHLPVPRVLAEDATGLCYLQTDLGNHSLYDALKKGREAGGVYSDEEKALLCRTIALLPTFQIVGGSGVDFNRCYPQAEMDRTNVLFDLNYFKYCFLKTTDVDFHEMRLEDDFQVMASDLTSDQSHYFMYRDFQARNVMLDDDGNPHFIDFQGGRCGPLQYDVASFLWQASAHYSDALREELIGTYLTSLRQYIDVDETLFLERLRLFVLFRLLQVLGAYGFRGHFERKQYFIDSIPPALHNLQCLLAKGACPYPYLHSVLTQLVSSQQFIAEVQRTSEAIGVPIGYSTRSSCSLQTSCEAANKGQSAINSTSTLSVRILSFSYRQGIPSDETGNGGGYVFDCRAIHNPGKYDEYKHMTGLDQPVIDFMERDGEILTFLDSVYRLADAHVKRYMQRGFTNLMFAFGCTGGQHRSVYAAQHLAERLNSRFGIEVHITHTARGIHTILPSIDKTIDKTAMVFAAGLGTRLRPLTDTMPKALVPVAGKPLIEHIVEKLRRSGFSNIVVNVHHFADMIEQWARGQEGITLSDERAKLLDTGGGIRHAIPLFGHSERILIHNVDILSNADLNAFWTAGEGEDAILLVSERQTNRYLLFDDLRLVGWTNVSTGEVKLTQAEIDRLHLAVANPNSPLPNLDVSKYRKLAFSGIHQISSTLFHEMEAYPSKAMQAQYSALSFTECWEEAKFSIIDFYISLDSRFTIRGYIQPNLRLLDIGKPATLPTAETFLALINGEV